MTTTATAPVATYDQLVEVQTRLVRRAVLRSSHVHEILTFEERAEFGSVWLTCSCGKHVAFKADDAERGEHLFVQHALFALRETLAVAA